MISTIYYIWASPVAQRVKKPPAMEETQEAWVLPVGWEDPLEEGMATLPIFLPGGISWIEEPGRLQFIGLQRIRHDWSHWACTDHISYYMPGNLHILYMYVSWNVYADIYVMLILWKPFKVDNAIISRLQMMLLGDWAICSHLEKVCLLVSNPCAFWRKIHYSLAQWFSMYVGFTWRSCDHADSDSVSVGGEPKILHF